MRFPEIVALTSALALVAAAPTDLSPQTAGTIEPRIDASSGLTNSDRSSGKDLFARENMLGMSDEAAIAADDAAADAEAASAEDADDDWEGDSPHWDDPGKDNIDPFDHCVKGEVGCHHKDAWVGYVFGILPIMRALIKHKKDRLNLRRYDMSCFSGQKGNQIRKTDYLEKHKCKSWKKGHDGDMAINFILPANKAFNHCDLKLYAQHDCHGEPFEIIYGMDDGHGNVSTQTYNAQSHCIEATGMKSFYIGDCSS
ncbi:hypothetical protein TI39_contig627g00008 [Zymoseptoria brevis]|uniref:Uncharacterized protein n=1 Tax=Zymoseptoria brevis TaxID=1047168 RepID=A0A0F4GJU3_9PEZI|nr:hypothetical protein TI39_contig627g00008 [Zymoseptoria brevis]